MCLLVTLDGQILKGMVIFRGFKEVPEMSKTFKEVVPTRQSGSMDKKLTTFWLDHVISSRAAYFYNTPSLLIWDSYGSHEKYEVKQHLRTKYRSEICSFLCLHWKVS